MGSRTPLLAPTHLTSPAFVLDICPKCRDQSGLCTAERCRREVLPQLAKPALVRLIGDSLVEQKKRQVEHALPECDAHKAWKLRRQRAQEIARSKRRGAFGLAKAIMERKKD